MSAWFGMADTPLFNGGIRSQGNRPIVRANHRPKTDVTSVTNTDIPNNIRGIGNKTVSTAGRDLSIECVKRHLSTLDKIRSFFHDISAYHGEDSIDKMENDTIQKMFRINRKDISYLKFLLDSYEGVAIPRTLDKRIALVEVMIPEGFYQTFTRLLDDVAEEMGMAPVITSRFKGESDAPHDA